MPELFNSFSASPVVKRACEKGALTLEVVDIKAYAKGSFRNIDDSPCGGGPGMLLRVDVLHSALKAAQGVRDLPGVKDLPKSHTVLFSPKGKPFNQDKARELAKRDNLILICGHYEGYDARIEKYVDEQISLGDFILTGGELAAMTVTDSIVRLLKGSLREGATEQESFENGLLEYPQYTHPVEYNGDRVPEVLLSGNQRAIKQWKIAQSVMETIKFRPELLNQDIVHSNFTELHLGKSGARILQFDDMILKIEDQSESSQRKSSQRESSQGKSSQSETSQSETSQSEASQREYEALNWLQGRLPVPALYGHEIKDNKSYILMSKVKGKMLCDPTILSNRRRLLKSAVAALRTLWSVDITDCPKAWYDKNSSNSEDLVLSHGDLCLPNIFVSCHGIEGFIDLGRVKVASKWRDIAIILKSLTDNLVGCYAQADYVQADYGQADCGQADYGSFDAQEFFDLLEMKPDVEKLKYYTPEILHC